MEVLSLRNVRSNFSEFVERVQTQHERFVITKNGTPAAMLISSDDLESLEETVSVLSHPDSIHQLTQALNEHLVGDVVRGKDAVKSLINDG